jgi:hypothetical protein
MPHFRYMVVFHTTYMDHRCISLCAKYLKINKMNKNRNPLKFNKIRVLWSDYLHFINPELFDFQ